MARAISLSVTVGRRCGLKTLESGDHIIPGHLSTWIRFKMAVAASCKMVSRIVAPSAEVVDDQAVCHRWSSPVDTILVAGHCCHPLVVHISTRDTCELKDLDPLMLRL